MLELQKIGSDSEIANFSKLFSEYVGVRLPKEYLKNGDVYLAYDFFSKKNVGGYAIIYNPPFRFLALLPEQIRNKNQFLLNNINNFYEVNGFFIKDHQFKLKIFEELLITVLKLKRKYLLLFYDLSNRKLHNTWQKNLKPIEIYSGKPNTNHKKLKSHKNIYFGYVEKKNIKQFLKIIRIKMKLCYKPLRRS